jgi:hypothetical protein
MGGKLPNFTNKQLSHVGLGQSPWLRGWVEGGGRLSMVTGRGRWWWVGGGGGDELDEKSVLTRVASV